jgi:hypothetical protein
VRAASLRRRTATTAEPATNASVASERKPTMKPMDAPPVIT